MSSTLMVRNGSISAKYCMNKGIPFIPFNDPSDVFELTLRDQFAMAALTGLCADTQLDYSTSDMAVMAYKFADAMMEAREK